MPRVSRKVAQHPKIWLCCTPKSASTYLDQILNHLWRNDCCSGSPVPFWNDRYQEPDVLSVAKAIGFSSKPYFSGHHHQRNTSFFSKTFLNAHLYEQSVPVIVQTRPLNDTLVSIKDMLDDNYANYGEVKGPYIVGLNADWHAMDDVAKYISIAAAYAFWHISFVKSWSTYPNAMYVTYSDVTLNTVQTVKNISDFCSIPKSLDEIEMAINTVNSLPKKLRRLNVGKSGRGSKVLPNEVIDYIEKLEVICGLAK